MTVCDLRNGHEKSSASGLTAFSGFLLSKSKISGNDVILFIDMYISKNHIRPPRGACGCYSQIVTCTFVIPQEITLKIFCIGRSHT